MTAVPAPDAPVREYSDVVYVFDPDRKSLPKLREYLRELADRREFMVELARSDIRGSRSHTLLGELWGVIDPLFQAAIYWFLLSIIRGNSATGVDRSLGLMVGCIFFFSYASGGLGLGAGSILKARNLMLNSTFPRALLPLAATYRKFLELIPAIGIYVIFHITLGMETGLGLLTMPLLLVIATALNVGTSLFFATLTVFFRDTSNLLTYVSRMLFFATPVIYPVSALGGTLRSVLRVGNPFFALFEAFQAALTGGVPSPASLAIAATWATVILIIGYRVFVSNERSFALRL